MACDSLTKGASHVQTALGGWRHETPFTRRSWRKVGFHNIRSKTASNTNREDAGYNQEMDCFVQSYENNTMLDSSILIAPLVFFIAPNDPRFIKTVERILLSPDKGGLTSAGLVYRYDTTISDDGEFCRFQSFQLERRDHICSLPYVYIPC